MPRAPLFPTDPSGNIEPGALDTMPTHNLAVIAEQLDTMNLTLARVVQVLERLSGQLADLTHGRR
jgi:hypothetical protein